MASHSLILNLLAYALVFSAKAWGAVLQLPQNFSVPPAGSAGYTQPELVGIEVQDPGVPLGQSRWYSWGGANATVSSALSTLVEVRPASAVWLWVAFLDGWGAQAPAGSGAGEEGVAGTPASPLAALQFAGLDMTAWPVGHPSRPTRCTAAGRITPSSPTGNASHLSCWSFLVPQGEGDGTQVELKQGEGVAPLARAGPYTCVVQPPYARVACWGAYQPSFSYAGPWPGYQPAARVPVAQLPQDLPPARQVVVTEYFGCILAAQGGGVLCWGGNGINATKTISGYGQVTYTPNPGPELNGTPQPLDMAPSRYIAASANIGCSIAIEDDRVRCWGQLRASVGVPQRLLDLAPANASVFGATVAIGDDLVVVLSRQGKITLFGGDAAAFNAAVQDLPPVVAVAAGNMALCVVFAAGGHVQCFGGACAENEAECTLSPDMSAASISMSGKTACMVTRLTGAPFCWKLPGHSVLTASVRPPATLRSVSSIAADHLYPCAVEGGTGEVVCWGDGGASPSALTYLSPRLSMPKAAMPPWAGLSASYYGTCAVDARTGALACWGTDRSVVVNKATDPGAYPVALPTQNKYLSSMGIVALNAHGGLTHTHNNRWWEWGNASFRPDEDQPQQVEGAGGESAGKGGVPGPVPVDGKNPTPRIATAAATANRLCVVFRGSRRAACVSTVRSTDIQLVPEDLPATASIAVADQYACAVAVGTGAVRCWGNAADIPTVPADLSPVAQLKIGPGVACALLAGSGTVRCWGPKAAANPWPPAGMGPAVRLDAHGIGTLVCAVLAGSLSTSCWEFSSDAGYGPFPDGVQYSRDGMSNGTLPPAHGLSVGLHHACIVDGDGQPACFGRPIDGLDVSIPDNVLPELSRGPVALRPQGWGITVCGRHPQAVGTAAPLECDTALGQIRYAPGNTLRGFISTGVSGSTNQSMRLSLAVEVSGLGPEGGSVMASGPTQHIMTICHWAPPPPSDCNDPQATLTTCFARRGNVSDACTQGGSVDCVVCDVPEAAAFGGPLATVQVTSAGYKLGWAPLLQPYQPVLEDVLLPPATPSVYPRNATDNVQWSYSVPWVKAGDIVTLTGSAFRSATGATAMSSGEQQAPVAQPSCVYLHADSDGPLPISGDEPAGCRCNWGREDYPGEGELPSTAIVAWNDTRITFMVPLTMVGLRRPAVCVWGAYARHPTSILAVSIPTLRFAGVTGATTLRSDGEQQQSATLVVRVKQAGIRTAAPAGPMRSFLLKSVREDIGWYAEPLEPGSAAAGYAWPTSRLVIRVGLKCFASQGQLPSLQPPILASSGNSECTDWGGWSAVFDSDTAVLSAPGLLPPGLLGTSVSVSLIDRRGVEVQAPGMQGVLPLDLLKPQLTSIEHGGLTGAATALRLLGTNLPEPAQVSAAGAAGWLQGSTGAAWGVSITLADLLTGNTTECGTVLTNAEGTSFSCTLPAGLRVGYYRLSVAVGSQLISAAALPAETAIGTGMADESGAFAPGIPPGMADPRALQVSARVDAVIDLTLGGGVMAVGCAPGYFGTLGEPCIPCSGALVPPGSALCPGGAVYPIPSPGWHALNTTDTLAACPVSKRDPNGRLVCVVPCEPREACMGANVCGVGYVDAPPHYRCSVCEPWHYKSSVGMCTPCSTVRPVLLTFSIVFIIALLLCLYTAHKAGLEFSVVPLLVDFWHMVSLVNPAPNGERAAVLPKQLHPVLDFAALVSLNVDVMEPECLTAGVENTFLLRFFTTVLLPPALLLVCLLLALPALIQAWKAKGTDKAQAAWKKVGKRTMLLRGLLRAFQFLYFIIVGTVLSVWNCTPSNPPEPDGSLYLAVAPYEKCNSDDPSSLQNRLKGFAGAAIFFYVAGLPIAMAAVFWFNSDAIVADQTARAAGDAVGPDDTGYWTRSTLSPLYAAYRPGKHWFSLVNLLRKALVNIIVLELNKAPSLRLTGAVVGLTIGLTVSAWVQPLLTPVWVSAKLAAGNWSALLVDRNQLHAGLQGCAVLIVSLSAVWFDVAPGTPNAVYYPNAAWAAVLAVLAVTGLAMVAGLTATWLDIYLQVKANRTRVPAFCAPCCRTRARTQKLEMQGGGGAREGGGGGAGGSDSGDEEPLANGMTGKSANGFAEVVHSNGIGRAAAAHSTTVHVPAAKAIHVTKGAVNAKTGHEGYSGNIGGGGGVYAKAPQHGRTESVQVQAAGPLDGASAVRAQRVRTMALGVATSGGTMNNSWATNGVAGGNEGMSGGGMSGEYDPVAASPSTAASGGGSMTGPRYAAIAATTTEGHAALRNKEAGLAYLRVDDKEREGAVLGSRADSPATTIASTSASTVAVHGHGGSVVTGSSTSTNSSMGSADELYGPVAGVYTPAGQAGGSATLGGPTAGGRVGLGLMQGDGGAAAGQGPYPGQVGHTQGLKRGTTPSLAIE